MTDSIVIEKNVPVPKGRRKLPDLPLEKMVAGDSFFMKMDDLASDSRDVQTLRQHVSRFQAKFPERRYRVVRDDSGEGMRVFRVI